jgi:WD40 repeat protein
MPTAAPAPTYTPTPRPTASPSPLPVGIAEVANLGRGSADTVAWSSDGESYAVGGSLGVRIYDAKTNKEVKFFAQENVSRVQFGPDNQSIGVESYSRIRVIRVADGMVLISIDGYTLWHATFSRDNRFFAYVSRCPERECSDTIHILDIESKNIIREFTVEPTSSGPTVELHPNTVTFKEIAFSPNGALLAAAGSDSLVHVWNISTGEPRFILKGHSKGVGGVSFSPDGKLLVSYDETRLILWDPATGKRNRSMANFSGPITKVAISPNNTSLGVVVSGKILQTRDVTTSSVLVTEDYEDPAVAVLQQLRSKGGYLGIVNGMAYSPDGQTLAVGCYSSYPILLWDIPTQKLRATIEAPAIQLIYSHRGDLLASSNEKGISIWDTHSNTQLATIEGTPIDDLVFSPDDSMLAFSSNGQIELWDMQQRVRAQSISTNGNPARFLTFSPDGDLVSAVIFPGSSVHSWDVSTGALLREFTPPIVSDYQTAVGLFDEMLAVFQPTDVFDNAVILLNARTGERIQTLMGINDYVPPIMAYDPATQVAAISYYYDIKFYDVNTSQAIYTYAGMDAFVNLAFSPDGQFLAVGDDYGNIRLWDISRIVRASSGANH